MNFCTNKEEEFLKDVIHRFGKCNTELKKFFEDLLFLCYRDPDMRRTGRGNIVFNLDHLICIYSLMNRKYNKIISNNEIFESLKNEILSKIFCYVFKEIMERYSQKIDIEKCEISLSLRKFFYVEQKYFCKIFPYKKEHWFLVYDLTIKKLECIK